MEDSASASAGSTSSAVSGEVSAGGGCGGGGGNGVVDDDEDSCRICRGPSELGKPLRYPCACRGTIKYVHQECLLLWLNRRKISRCEVCKHEFSYAPVYAQNAPVWLSPKEFVFGLAAKLVHLLGILQYFAYLFFVWLLAIPLVTHWIWEFAFFKGFSEARSLFMSHLTFTTILADCMHGFLLSLGMAYVFLGITIVRLIFVQGQRGAPGVGNRVNANENGENAGGRQGIAKFLQIIKRSVVYLSAWWKVSVARIMVHLRVVEIAHVNEHVNMQAAFFPFDENAFAVIASNLIFTVILVLLPFCIGRIATLLQSWISSSTTAQIFSSMVPTIEEALLSVDTKAKNALNAITHCVLYFYGVSVPSQVLEEDSKILDKELSKIAKASNIVSGLVSAGLYNEQPSETPSLSDDTTLFIGYMVILAFVMFYFGTVFIVRYARGEPLTLQRLSGFAFRIDAALSFFRRFFTLFREVMIMVSRNFLTILKVAILLGVKVVLFPLMCGWWLDVCTLRMFGQTITERIELSVKNPLLMSLAHWIFGILYLMYVFLHVNLIQEVLHDGVFRLFPNISEPGNFFSRMIECPMFKHACNLLLLVGIHGSLMVLLVFLPIKLVTLCVPSAFPLNLFYSEAKTVTAVILRRTLFQFGIPSTIRFYCPSRTFKFLLHKWLSVICALLGLSDYVLPRLENNGGHAEQLRQQRVLNLSLVAIIEGSIIRLQQPGNTNATRDDKGEEGLEVDCQFAVRVTLLLILAWMIAVVFNSLMIAGPLLLGRSLFQAASHFYISRGFKYDDFCSFIFGSCSLRAIIICAEFSVEHVQARGARAFLSQIRKCCMAAFRICALVSLGMFFIPTLIGLLLDLVVVVPIKLPLHFTLFKCWGLGWIFLVTLFGLVIVDFMHSVDGRWLVKLQRLLTDGLSRRPILWILKEILIPMMMMLQLALCTPYMLARLVLAMLGYPLLVNSAIHRFVWPGCFAFGILWLCAKIIRAFVIYLHDRIRDDRYCVGQRLQDYGELVLAKPNGEVNALELQE